MFCCVLLACICLLLPPPLTEAERAQVDAGVGSAETRQDAAFEALVESARRWEAAEVAPEENASALSPEAIAGLTAGEAVLLEGDLLRAEALPQPFAEIRRWILAVPAREAEAVLVVVFVVGGEDVAALEARQTPHLRLSARFYKVMRLPSGGDFRPYPAFVGAHPQAYLPPAAKVPPVPLLFVIILLIAGLLLVVLFVSVAAKAKGQARARATEADLSQYDSAEPLPAEPAEALGELARRAKETR